MNVGTKRRVYVDDPSEAPPGAQLVTGPLGGIYWENNAPAGRVTRGGIEGEGSDKKPGGGAAKPAGGRGGARRGGGGGAGKKPEKPEKRQSGQPFKDANDASLPERVKKEPPERRDLFVRTFNAILEAGGGEIDAARLATQKLGEPERQRKQQEQAKRETERRRREDERKRKRKGLEVLLGEKVIRREGSQYVLYTQDGSRRLGTFRSRRAAVQRERQIQFFKRQGKEAAVSVLVEDQKKGFRKLPKGWTAASARSFFNKMGGQSMSVCIRKMRGNVTNPAAFCQRLHQQATGRSNRPGPGKELDAMFVGQKAPDAIPLLLVEDVEDEELRADLKEHGVAALHFANGGLRALDDDQLGALLGTALGTKDVDEKCSECGPSAMPEPSFGGATSFDELDAFVESLELSQDINELSYQFRALVDNTMGAMMMDPKEKAAAVAKAASDFHSRIMALPEGEEKDALLEDSIEAFEIAGRQISAAAKEGKRVGKQQVGMLKRMFEDLKSLLGWASYEDMQPEEGKKVLLSDHGGLQIYEKEGVVRWLTYSSNAFEDIEGEVFSTKSLEDAVAWADAVGERGPLRIFHVPGADVGHCDYQAVFGRFLVESGTFADTPIGRKAKEYFLRNRDKRFGVSIGYLYRQGDELDGTYDWLRIRERSVTPEGMAANPWTEFTLGGDVMTDARKAAFLEEILGKEAATTIISDAERRTKELEPLVRHKAAEASAPPAVAVAATPAAGEAPPPVAGEEPPEGEDEQTKEIRTALAGLKDVITVLAGVPAAIAALEKDVADLKRSDDEKIAAQLAPRARVAAEAASAKDGNVPGEELVKIVTGGDKDTPGPSPVSVYVQDLMRRNGVPVS